MRSPRAPLPLAQVDTRDILFVVGGAFIDLERQLLESRHQASIGFGNKARLRRIFGRGHCPFGARARAGGREEERGRGPDACRRRACLESACAPSAPPPGPRQVRAATMGQHGGPRISSSILAEVEHADLINYGGRGDLRPRSGFRVLSWRRMLQAGGIDQGARVGWGQLAWPAVFPRQARLLPPVLSPRRPGLIPEFVGRLPIVSVLQARPLPCAELRGEFGPGRSSGGPEGCGR